MDLFPVQKTLEPAPASLPLESLTFPPPCNQLSVEPIQLAPTSFDSSKDVTPEDLSPNAYLLQQAHCPLPFSQPKPLHHSSFTEDPCSSAPQLQNSSPTLGVLPTIFDFVNHSHFLQSKTSLQACSSKTCPTGLQFPPAPSNFSHDTNLLQPNSPTRSFTQLQLNAAPSPKPHLPSPPLRGPRTHLTHSTFAPALTLTLASSQISSPYAPQIPNSSI